MAEPRNSTCEPWATTADLCSPCDDYSVDQALMEDWLQAASDVLYVLSGRQYPGICSDTVWVLKRHIHRTSPLDPAIRRRRYVPADCGDRVSLGMFPLVSITEVVIDGAVVPADQYRIDDYRWLTRVDEQSWRWTDTFKVTATYGRTPPAMGVRAAATLACELYKACQPEDFGECRLPQRVQSITRQGVSMVVLDPFEFLDDGKTGLYDVDLFLKTVNPSRLARRPSVMTPDIGPRVRREGT